MHRFLLLLLLLIAGIAQAQDTIVLITGKVIPVKSVDYRDYSIDYRTADGLKLKSIDAGRVFSVKYANGAERVIFRTDSLDAADFSEDEMRRFIIGEQDARQFYRNQSSKFLGFAIGGGSSLGGFFGLPVPLIFSTAIGGFSPNVEKTMTFKVEGSAARTAGFPQEKFVNSAVGTTSSPTFESGSELYIDGKYIKFEQSAPLDTAIRIINDNFKSHRVHAAKVNDKLKLYRSTNDANITDPIYLEGFEKRSRDYKIRTSLIGGLAGYIAGAITFSLLFH
jgi:hypothetical protein